MSGLPDIGMYACVSKDGAATTRASWFETLSIAAKHAQAA